MHWRVPLPPRFIAWWLEPTEMKLHMKAKGKKAPTLN
jgi:hypothetical protein